MNKAKVILSALALFAVVGGALAFKAIKFQPSQLFSSYATITTRLPGGGLTTLTLCSVDPFYNSTTGVIVNPVSTYWKTTTTVVATFPVCATVHTGTTYSSIAE